MYCTQAILTPITPCVLFPPPLNSPLNFPSLLPSPYLLFILYHSLPFAYIFPFFSSSFPLPFLSHDPPSLFWPLSLFMLLFIYSLYLMTDQNSPLTLFSVPDSPFLCLPLSHSIISLPYSLPFLVFASLCLLANPLFKITKLPLSLIMVIGHPLSTIRAIC